MLEASNKEIKLFYCYAREDKALRDELEKHLGWLKRRYQLTNWHDREILPGEEWEQAIDKHLSTADLILLLISPDFIASDYCYGKEMQQALERHKEGTCRVIPILLRPTYWEEAPFSSLQLLPTNAKPITRWQDQDEAFQDVVAEISRVIRDLNNPNSTNTSPSTQIAVAISPLSYTYKRWILYSLVAGYFASLILIAPFALYMELEKQNVHFDSISIAVINITYYVGFGGLAIVYGYMLIKDWSGVSTFGGRINWQRYILPTRIFLIYLYLCACILGAYVLFVAWTHYQSTRKKKQVMSQSNKEQ